MGRLRDLEWKLLAFEKFNKLVLVWDLGVSGGSQ